MACYYYLRLPAGGELRISTSFGTLSLTKTDDLRGLIDNYKNETENAKAQLASYIKSNTPLHWKTADSKIDSLLKDHSSITTEQLNEFIESINSAVEDQGDFKGLQEMLYLSVYKKGVIESLNTDTGVWEPIKVELVVKKLQKPIYTNYFKDIDADTVMGGRSYNNVIDTLKLKQAQWDSLGLDARIYSHFQTILKHLYPNRGGIRTTKTLFETKFNSKSSMGIDDSVLIYDESLEKPIVFYNQASGLSLHIAALKMLGISALSGSEEQLKAIILEFNKKVSESTKINPELTAMEFFNGVIDSDGNKQDPEFYKMLNVNYGQKSLEDIAVLIASKSADVSEQEKLQKALISIMKFMEPTNLSKFNDLLNTNRAIKKQQSNQVVNAEKMQIQRITPLSTKENRKLYYNVAKTSGVLESADNIKQFLDAKITKTSDIILISQKSNMREGVMWRYIVPTYWKVVDGGVFIRGWYDDHGVLTEYNGILPKGVDIKYAELASMEPPTIYTTPSIGRFNNPLVVKINPAEPLAPNVILSILRRGSFIKYKSPKTGVEHSGNVKNVLPGGIELNNIFIDGVLKPLSININTITEIHTDREALGTIIPDQLLIAPEGIQGEKSIEEAIEKNVQNFLLNSALNITKRMKKVAPDAPISNYDWVMYVNEKKEARRNLVIGVNNNTVYILIQTSKGSRIESIKRDQIKEIFKVPEVFDNNVRKTISSFYTAVLEEQSLRKFNYSIFTNKEFLRNGDYIWSPSEKILYKVSNIDNNELVKFSVEKNQESVTYVNKFPADGKFLTTRNVASENYGVSIDFNNFYLVTADGTNDKQVKKTYFVPIDTVLTEDMLLASGNLTTGFVQVDGYKLQGEEVGMFRDATQELVNLLNKRNGTQNNFLAVTEYKGFIQRYSRSLHETKYDNKEKNKFLQEYAYITLKREVNSPGGTKIIDSHKYKIVSRSGNMLLLEYNAYNSFGRVITVNKYLNLETEEDKISRLYVMYGNKNIDKLKELDTKNENKQAEVQKQDMISEIRDSFKVLYDIPVISTTTIPPELAGKRAWIEVESAKSKRRIVINATLKDTDRDVVHEYLHLFLTAAKYNNPGFYESLMTSYLQGEQAKFADLNPATLRGKQLNRYNLIMSLSTSQMDFNTVEELFVTDVNEAMWKDPTSLQKIDHNSFLTLFDKIMKDLKVIEQDDNIFSPEWGSYDSMFAILNYKMSDIFKEKGGNKIAENANVIFFDANFKAWLESLINSDDTNKDSLTINCN